VETNRLGSNELHAAAVALGRLGGKSKSPDKIRASRENGKRGGRPRKKTGVILPTLLITEKGKQS
jgi:hypothetical protein